MAFSNRRMVALDPQARTVTFTYRDYRHASQVKTATLNSVDPACAGRRFASHPADAGPLGLVRIRHYGILGNNRRDRDIPRARGRTHHKRKRRRRSGKDDHSRRDPRTPEQKETREDASHEESRQGAREEQPAPALILDPPLPRAIPLHSVTLHAAAGYERKNLQEKHRPS